MKTLKFWPILMDNIGKISPGKVSEVTTRRRLGIKIDKIAPYFWKTPIFGVALFVGAVMGDLFANQVGLETPDALLTFTPFTLALYLLAISPILLATVLFICRMLTGNFIVHWLILSMSTWLVYSFGATMSDAPSASFWGLSLYLIIMMFFASSLGTGAVVLMFPEHYRRQKRTWARR